MSEESVPKEITKDIVNGGVKLAAQKDSGSSNDRICSLHGFHSLNVVEGGGREREGVHRNKGDRLSFSFEVGWGRCACPVCCASPGRGCLHHPFGSHLLEKSPFHIVRTFLFLIDLCSHYVNCYLFSI